MSSPLFVQPFYSQALKEDLLQPKLAVISIKETKWALSIYAYLYAA